MYRALAHASLVSFSILTFACTLQAQAVRSYPTIVQGDRVRFTLDTPFRDRYEATVASVSPESLYVIMDSMSTPRGFARTGLFALDVGAGKQTHEVRDAIIGAVAGAGIGAVAVTVFRPAASLGGCSASTGQSVCKRPQAARNLAAGAAIGGAVGIVGGWLIGHFIPTERWMPVTLRIAPAGSPSSLSLQLRF
jgi:hypothetical protein